MKWLLVLETIRKWVFSYIPEVETGGGKCLSIVATGTHNYGYLTWEHHLVLNSVITLVCFLVWICQIIASIICFTLAVESWPEQLFLFPAGSQLSDLIDKTSSQCQSVGRTHIITFHHYCGWDIILLSVYVEQSCWKWMVLK